MKIDVEKINATCEAASAEQKERMFSGTFESAKSKDSEETLETLVDKLESWQNQNKANRGVALFAIDKDRTEEKGNTVISIGGSTATLLNLAINVSTQGEIKNPLAKLFALALMSNIKDNLENNLKDSLENNLKDSKHGTDN